jgi:hypothetical protein
VPSAKNVSRDYNSRGQSEEDIKRVEGCLKAAWDALPNTLFKELIESIESRIKMYIKADRWHTKY